MCLYVDDILIVGSNEILVESTKGILNSSFDMKDMGLADVILGIKITRTADGFVSGQSHYVDKILDKFGKESLGVYRTPIDMNQHLSKNKGESVSQVEYSRVIGSLTYLMNCTRPDIAYTVSRWQVVVGTCKSKFIMSAYSWLSIAVSKGSNPRELDGYYLFCKKGRETIG